MASICLSFVLFFIFYTSNAQDLPTNYEYYTTGGIEQGLSVDQTYFTLNNRNISIYSGTLHYFRVHRAHWRDSLRKMRAAGLNAVETYVSWNLHEPVPGQFDFGNSNNDMSDFLHLEEFLNTAKEEDLFVILRPGPFICAEFEFGGFPSWILRDDDIEVRTTNTIYMQYVTRYFNVLLPIVAGFQFTSGGPIIMVQVENEYAVSGKKDLEYLRQIRELMLNNGIKELLVTSDNPPRGTSGTIPSLFFMTGNFDTNATYQLDVLKQHQPNKPLMVMEYWSGWFDFWGSRHNNKTVDTYKEVYEDILKYPSSVNIYIFRGSTNFGFLNGAMNNKYDDFNSDYHSIITSYDYSAPLDETGAYTEKYFATKELLEKYNPIKTKLPDIPTVLPKLVYQPITVTQQLQYDALLNSISPVYSPNLIPMEKLDINNNAGQSFGYVVYRKTNLNIPANSLLVIEGRVCDIVIVLVNRQRVSPSISRSTDLNNFGTNRIENSSLVLSDTDINGATLDLVVENWGRINVRVYKALKGLWQGGVKLNEQYLTDWIIYPLEFKKSWTNSLTSNWVSPQLDANFPSLYKATLQVDGPSRDTFIDMSDWTKGIVIINGFVLGRYARIGPTQTLYLPGPLLQQGSNDIVVFEHYTPAATIKFSDQHIYLHR